MLGAQKVTGTVLPGSGGAGEAASAAVTGLRIRDSGLSKPFHFNRSSRRQTQGLVGGPGGARANNVLN